MKRRLVALSALLYGGHAVEDAPPVCRLGEDFAEDGTPCQAEGDSLLQTNGHKVRKTETMCCEDVKHTPGDGGDPPPEANQGMQTRS